MKARMAMGMRTRSTLQLRRPLLIVFIFFATFIVFCCVVVVSSSDETRHRRHHRHLVHDDSTTTRRNSFFASLGSVSSIGPIEDEGSAGYTMDPIEVDVRSAITTLLDSEGLSPLRLESIECCCCSSPDPLTFNTGTRFDYDKIRVGIVISNCMDGDEALNHFEEFSMKTIKSLCETRLIHPA